VSGGAVVVIALLGFALATLRSRRAGTGITIRDDESDIPREQWTMPPLALLEPPLVHRPKMLTMRGYLVISVILLIVKAAQLGGA
jgi:hypothetical protein